MLETFLLRNKGLMNTDRRVSRLSVFAFRGGVAVRRAIYA